MERTRLLRADSGDWQFWKQQWMETHIFAFSLIIEGTTEKVLQFILPLKSIYNKNLGFVEQKNVFLNTTERFQQ
jgi:hypothetical protein